MDQRDEELHRLRGCVRDLTALSALPLIWVGQEAPEVVGSFLETLLVSLRLDLAYARVEDPRIGRAIELARADGQPGIAHRAHEIGLAIARRYRRCAGCAKRSRYRIQYVAGC